MIQQSFKTVIDRIETLLKGLRHNMEDVAVQYAHAFDTFGNKLETGLIKRGFTRAWLRTLYKVGSNEADVRVLELEPEKIDIILKLPIIDQRKLLDDTVNLDKLSPAALRKKLNQTEKRNPGRRATVRRSHVMLLPEPPKRSSTKKRSATKPKARVSNRGIHLRGQLFLWKDLVDALKKASAAGTIPKEVIKELKALK